MDEHERRLAFVQLRLQPVQLLFPERADRRIEIGVVLRAGVAEKIVQVEELEPAARQ
jgi:hypothetical protein